MGGGERLEERVEMAVMGRGEGLWMEGKLMKEEGVGMEVEVGRGMG